MIGRSHCTRFVGQHVVFGTNGGVHHGILHSVTSEGIVVRPVGSGSTRLAYMEEEQQDINLLQDGQQSDSDPAQVWFPFLFFPFFALAWLGPWGWGW